jgi:hypothetical protein
LPRIGSQRFALGYVVSSLRDWLSLCALGDGAFASRSEGCATVGDTSALQSGLIAARLNRLEPGLVLRHFDEVATDD